MKTMNHNDYGLSSNGIKTYWDARAAKHAERTVGFDNVSLDKQDKFYAERYAFVKAHMPCDLSVLDFGCGTGRYSHLFHPHKYLGVDICDTLLQFARTSNPGYNYMLLPEPIPVKTGFVYDVFFTSTVLQHNNDECVSKILGFVRDANRGRKIIFCLYENTSELPGRDSICFRTVEQYTSLVAASFNVIKQGSWSHVVHGERHSLIVIEVGDEDNKSI